MNTNEWLEQSIESVAARTGLLPSVVRHCLTSYADNPLLLAIAWDEGWDAGAGWPQTEINPYRRSQ
jgi:hypothetical protein